ncbi:MAG: autotransporter-associated beta strand repeat-containing protein, partial [Ottowia sp.]|nr:autotransporter-associated beta strand repeat-containing protein [Ottowia sp.]
GGGGGGGGGYVGDGYHSSGSVNTNGRDGYSIGTGGEGGKADCNTGASSCDAKKGDAGADGGYVPNPRPNGGKGGEASEWAYASHDAVHVTGGGGGRGGKGSFGGGEGGHGGAGGDAIFKLRSDVSATSLTVSGGEGNTCIDDSDGCGTGGAGGAARVENWGAFNLTVGSLTVTSGLSGQGSNPGAGGAATLEVNTLKANTISLTKRDGDLSVKAGTLDVTDRDTTLTLTGTGANNVAFNTVKLGGDHTLAATGDGKASIGTLRLTGAGRIYAAGDSDPNSYGRFSVGSLVSDGGVLNDDNWFNLGSTHRVYTATSGITIESGGLTIDLSASNTNNQNLSRKLTGTGALTKTGTNTLILSNTDNDYQGGTRVEGGTLRLTDLGATGTGAGAVNMASGTTLELAASGSYANQITGAGKVTADPGMGETLTLRNTGNTYTGGTQVRSGTLEVTNFGQLGTGAVHVETGATLRLNAPLGSSFPALTSSGGTLEVWAGAGDNLTGKLDGFSRYAFDASALSTSLAALTVRDLNNPTLTIDASQVSLDTRNGGLNLQFGQSAALISLTSGTLTLTGGGVAQRIRLDNAPSGLVESAYSLTTGTSTNTLYLAFAEHYLYGTGGKNTTGQRERDNTLNLTSGMAAAAAAFGGRAATGDATGNTVNMVGGALGQDASNPLSGNVYGGHADTGSAVNNTVAMSGGNAVHVNGGWSQASATSNTVDMSDGQANYVYGGYSDGGSAESNTVTISGNAEVTDDVCGGWGRVSATGNTLDMPGGQAHSVHGGCSDTGSVERNT